MQNNLRLLVVSFIFMLFFPSISAFAVDDSLFYTPYSYTVGKAPWGVVVARLDASQDTFVDLAVSNSESDSVTILKNNGNGTFTKLGNYPAGPTPRGIFAAKLVGNDDYVDLVVANYESTGTVKVLKNQGNNSFIIVQTCTTKSLPYSVHAADLDLDGDNDLAIGNFGLYSGQPGSITIYRNNNGTFGNRQDDNTKGRPFQIVAAKLLVGTSGNPDNYPEIAVAGYLFTTASDCACINVFRNKGDTANFFDTTSANRLSYYGHQQYSIFAADLDGDSDNDLVTAAGQEDAVNIFKNLADTAFAERFPYPVGDFPFSVFAADLDGDGDKDLTTANTVSGDVSVLINMNDTAGTFDSLQHYPAGGFEPYAVYAFLSHDFSGDTKLDLAVTNEDTNTVSILWNLMSYWPPAESGSYRRGDADDDGDIDTTDYNRLTNYIFGKSGWPPCICNDNRCWLYKCEKFRGDWNGDGNVNLTDILRCSNYLNENFNPGGRWTPIIRDQDEAWKPLKPQ